MFNRLISYAALYGFLAVAFGAFGAHALKDLLNESQHAIFDKAVQYQMFHSLAILATAFLYNRYPNKIFYRSGLAFIIGIFCFSGSLYILSCKDLIGLESTKVIGPVTPIGGIFFLVGWAMMLAGALKIKD